MPELLYTPAVQDLPVALVSYCYGPTGAEGVGLQSGQLHSGRYAFWISTQDALLSTRLNGFSDTVNRSSNGVTRTLFSGISLLDAEDHYSQLTSCFDNSSNPIVAIQQDNAGQATGIFPYIYVSYNSGTRLTGWSGHYPMVYNNLNVNFPTSTGAPYFPIYKTGSVGCYYMDASHTNLYVRYLSDEFSSGTLVLSGLDPSYRPSHVAIAPQEADTNRNPYVKRIHAYNGDDLVLYTSKPFIKHAFDDFETYETGYIQYLDNGYGRWIRLTSLHGSAGLTAFQEEHFFEDFESYTSGSISSLDRGTLRTRAIANTFLVTEYIGYFKGAIVTGASIFGSDDFESYITGAATSLSSGVNSGIRFLTAVILSSGSGI